MLTNIMKSMLLSVLAVMTLVTLVPSASADWRNHNNGRRWDGHHGYYNRGPVRGMRREARMIRRENRFLARDRHYNNYR